MNSDQQLWWNLQSKINFLQNAQNVLEFGATVNPNWDTPFLNPNLDINSQPLPDFNMPSSSGSAVQNSLPPLVSPELSLPTPSTTTVETPISTSSAPKSGVSHDRKGSIGQKEVAGLKSEIHQSVDLSNVQEGRATTRHASKVARTNSIAPEVLKSPQVQEASTTLQFGHPPTPQKDKTSQAASKFKKGATKPNTRNNHKATRTPGNNDTSKANKAVGAKKVPEEATTSVPKVDIPTPLLSSDNSVRISPSNKRERSPAPEQPNKRICLSQQAAWAALHPLPPLNRSTLLEMIKKALYRHSEVMDVPTPDRVIPGYHEHLLRFTSSAARDTFVQIWNATKENNRSSAQGVASAVACDAPISCTSSSNSPTGKNRATETPFDESEVVELD